MWTPFFLPSLHLICWVQLDYLVYQEDAAEQTNSTNTGIGAASTSAPVADISTYRAFTYSHILRLRSYRQKRINIASLIGGLVAGIFVIGGAVLWYCCWRHKKRKERLQQIARPTMFTAEHSHSVHTPLQGEKSSSPHLPRTRRDDRSLSMPRASSKIIVPSYRPRNASSTILADDRSDGPPFSHGAIRASSVESSFSPTTSGVVSAAPYPTPEDIQTDRNDTQGMASQMRNPVGSLSSFHPPAVVNRVYEAPLEEPVEEGLMSMRPTPRSMPPPYGHG
jgi:hypothetical protein